MNINDNIKLKLQEVLKSLGLEIELDEIVIQQSDTREHGDYFTNVCLKNAKKINLKPFDLSTKVASIFELEGIDKAEAVMPGFLNFFLKADELGSVIKEIISLKENYGNLIVGKNKKANIEYVSANPTGTLHLGHARGAAIGDCLARIYKKAGYDVTREYYINDAGNQIDHLADSVIARYFQKCGIDKKVPDDGYHGEEIVTVANNLYNKVKDSYLKDIDSHYNEIKIFAENELLNNIKKDLHDFNVDQDVYTSEKAIRDRGDIEKVLEKLKSSCYTQDNALFLNTTRDGDDKDRVLVKSDGSYTYLLPDIAYHLDKYNRGYDILVDLFGADHHGYIARLKSAMKSLGKNPDILHIELVQMVRLFKNGEEFKMSKRTGNAISMKELIEEVGVDATRYFFVSRANSSHLDFNIDLAKSLGSENPVYYVQYTHARLNGILNNGQSFYPLNYDCDLLTNEKEKNVLIALRDFSNVIESALNENEPYKITNYVYSLSSIINEFYTVCRVIDDKNIELTKQRLGLVEASKIVLKEALSLIGVSAPDKMISLNNKD